MNTKLRNHVNILFAAAPKTAKAEEVKEELLTNLNDKYNDLLAQGYDSTAAFHIALSSIGNLGELLSTCGGAVQWNPPMPPKPIGAVPVVTFTRPAMSKAARIVLYLALALGTPTLGLGLVSFFALADAPGLGVLLMFLCWAASPVFLLLAIVAMFSPDSRQVQEYYQWLVLSQAERHGFSEEFVKNELRTISRQNKLRSAVLILLIVVMSFVLVGGAISVARVVNKNPFVGGFIPTGPIVKHEQEIGDFSRIEVLGAFSVEYKPFDKNLVVIETHEDMMRFIDTQVEKGGKLLIQQNGLTMRNFGIRRFRNVQKLHVTVYGKNEIRLFAAQDASRLVCEEPLKTDNIKFRLNGASNIDVKNLECRMLDLDMRGAGTAKVAGKAERVTVDMNGASKVHAHNFEADRCEVSISGASKVEFGTISKELSVSASGASRLDYRGTPTIKKQEVSGAATVYHY